MSCKAPFFKLVFKRADSPHGRRIGGSAEGFANSQKEKCSEVVENIFGRRAALSNGADG
jgi:hypothetical protein